MRGVPLIASLLGAVLAACGGAEEPLPETPGVEAIPFVGDPAAGGAFVSGAGDTLRLASHPAPDEPGILLIRTQAGDSVAARIDATTLAPLASYRRHRTNGDSLVAVVEYGAGFEGQARLTLARGGGRASENLRTPAPYLDAAQIPLTLGALDYSMPPDTISFNYVAPFEKRALAARLVVGPAESLRVGAAAVPARPVRVEVQGLQEIYWYGEDGRLWRIEEPTRGLVWARIPDAADTSAP